MVWDFITRFRRVCNLKCMNYVWNLPVHSDNVSETTKQISAGEEGCLHSDARSSISICLPSKSKKWDIQVDAKSEVPCLTWHCSSSGGLFLVILGFQVLGCDAVETTLLCVLYQYSPFSLHPLTAYLMQTVTKLKASNKHGRYHWLYMQC